MRIHNEAVDPEGPLHQLLQAQADFHARLADETLRYLRRLSALSGPWVPGTVVTAQDDGALDVSGPPGSQVRLELEVENRQDVHCLVTPVLTTMIDRVGTTWYPDFEAHPPTSLLAPGDCTCWEVSVDLPLELPGGEYHGALLLHGFTDGGIPTTIRVSDSAPGEPTPDEAENSAPGEPTPDQADGTPPVEPTPDQADGTPPVEPTPDQAEGA